MPVYVITYNRPKALSELLKSFSRHGIKCDAIIDDGSNNRRFIEELAGGSSVKYDSVIDADIIEGTPTIVLGRRNVGVAGNSNRALELYRRSGENHLCLCNDDILATGNFVNDYFEAHRYGAGLLCFTPKNEHTQKVGKFRVASRIYGAMISIWRTTFDKIGFFDTSFGKFGHEHCDYTHRARITGAMGNAVSVDVENPKIELQEVDPSLTQNEKMRAEDRANEFMETASKQYFVTPLYRSFSLEKPRTTGVNGIGIAFHLLQNSTVVRA